MKLILIAALAAATLAANAANSINWPSLPSGTLPDSQVTTNATFQVDLSKMQEASFQLEVSGSVSNEVIVAIGADENNDGDLSFNEAAFFIGNDCEDKYVINLETGEVTDNADTVKVKARNFDPGWNTAKIIKRGLPVVNEAVSMRVENKKFVIHIR